MLENPLLLAAIIAEPDEDTPRLAYADWLEENAPSGKEGEAERRRAEFIRVQVEKAKLERDPEMIYTKRWNDLEKRADYLFHTYNKAWGFDVYASDRGFRHLAAIHSADEFLGDTFEALCKQHPITHIKACHPTYSATGNFTDEDLIRITESPRLAQIRSLDLSLMHISDQGLRALLASPYARNLTELDISWTNIGAEGIQALADSPLLAQLRTLHVGGYHPVDTPQGRTAMYHLLNSPGMENMRELHITPFRMHAANALYHASFLPNLHTLDLYIPDNSPHIAQRLATAPCLRNLRSLRLETPDLGDIGATALAECPYLSNLRKLELAYAAIGPEGARALANSPVLKQLRELNLYSNPVGDSGAEALAQHKGLPALDTLGLSVEKDQQPGISEKAALAFASPKVEMGAMQVWLQRARTGLSKEARKTLKKACGEEHIKFGN